MQHRLLHTRAGGRARASPEHLRSYTHSFCRSPIPATRTNNGRDVHAASRPGPEPPRSHGPIVQRTARLSPEQPQHPVRPPAAVTHESSTVRRKPRHRVSGRAGRITNRLLNLAGQFRGDSLVGVDRQHPLARGVAERQVFLPPKALPLAGGHKLAAPQWRTCSPCRRCCHSRRRSTRRQSGPIPGNRRSAPIRSA